MTARASRCFGGLQIAAGVPLQCDEGPDYRSFRLGLFGIDKLKDVPGTLDQLEKGFNAVLPASA